MMKSTMTTTMMRLGQCETVLQFQKLLLVVVVVMVAMTTQVNGTITCEAFTSQQDSTVTCYFGVDVASTKHNFNLQFYYPNLQADPETLLMCNWVTSGEIECKKSTGINFNYVISTQLTVKGPPMTEKLSGKYVCQLVPSINVPATPCNLTFRVMPETPAPSPRDPALLEEINERSVTSLSVSIATLIVLIIAIIIAVIIYFFKDWITQRCKRPGTESNKVKVALEDDVVSMINLSAANHKTGQGQTTRDVYLQPVQAEQGQAAIRVSHQPAQTGQGQAARDVYHQPAQTGHREAAIRFSPQPAQGRPYLECEALEATSPEGSQRKKKKRFWLFGGSKKEKKRKAEDHGEVMPMNSARADLEGWNRTESDRASTKSDKKRHKK